MKITFRTLDKKEYKIEASESDKISDLKQKISDEHKHPVDWQKLIYSGKMLEDGQTVGELGVKETDFMVLMVRKPKASAAKASSTSTPATTSSTPAAATTTTTESKPSEPKPMDEDKPADEKKADEDKAEKPTEEPTSAVSAAESNVVVGNQQDEVIANIMAMGYEREMVVRALNAAFGNPDRAVEFLLTGNIPSGPAAGFGAPVGTGAGGGSSGGFAMPGAVNAPGGEALDTSGEMPTDEEAGAAGVPLGQASGGGAAGAAAGATDGPFAALRQNPQFDALRLMIQRNPAALQPVLAQLGQQEPELLRLIQENQEEFIAMINEPVSEEAIQRLQQQMAQMEQGGAAGAGAPGGQPGMQPGVIQVTAEEKAVIERLEGMGFDRNLVIEAYLACDKNEDLAVNYILERMNE